MTILTLNKKELEKKVGKIDDKITKAITDFGTPVEEITDSEVSVEVFPNRPDLLSLQNFARALRQYLEKESVAHFKINKPEKDYKVIIDKSVKSVRSHTACAIVKNLKFDDEKIKEVIDIQEKLHGSIGRKRKKLAIGIYPLEQIKLPITFKALSPKEIKFKPLEFPREITGLQILSQHPAGREYAELLEGAEVFPIFVDANNEIMSMPPIINSDKTGRITEKTKDIFIECSGHNLHYLKKCLNIIVASLAGMEGEIYSMEIVDKVGGSFTSPNLEPQEMEFDIKKINKMLGLELSEKHIKKNLERMGIGYEEKKGKSKALVPAYRTDILHWVDLAEEVAIAYGYDNFVPEIPKISTTAEENLLAKRKRTISNILAGLGILEVSSFHLNSKKDVKKIHFEFKDFIEIEDSKTENDCLRIDLLTNTMKIFSENSDSQYPQKIFEMGRVFELDKEEKTETGILEKEKLVVGFAGESVNFTELKQSLDYLLKMIGKAYKIENSDEHPAFIKGRAGKILIGEKSVGFIGEIAPRVLKNWKIKMPVVALEVDLEKLI